MGKYLINRYLLLK